MRITIDGKPEEIKKLFSSCNTKQSGRPLSSEERKKIWKDAAKDLNYSASLNVFNPYS